MQSQRLVDGITYDVKQEMVRRGKPQGAIKQLLTTALGLSFGVPLFAFVAPFWYVIMLNKSIAQRLSAVFLPVLMPMIDKGFVSIKKELLKDLHGRVLDVGCGSGDWLKYFAKASFITELEPNSFHRPNIEKNVESFKKDNPNVDVEIVHKFVGELDQNKPYDYVVFGNVMCEVPDPKSFLEDIDKILKPGGKIVFIEHIRYPRGTFLGLLQDIVNVWWCKAVDGCHCNRDTVEVLKSIPGWKVEFWDLVQDGPPNVTRMAVGIITKQGSSTVSESVAKM